MVTTPVDDFVRQYAASDVIRAHMPGHKGIGGGEEQLDLTEITGADSLYAPEGILLESEMNAARLFGSRLTVYSTEGASLGIRAMLKLALGLTAPGCGRQWLLAGRNAHRTLMTAAALLDFDIRWLYPEDGSALSAGVSADALDQALSAAGAPPFAVYLTSPDYLGGMADIGRAAAICHAHGTPLLVDNAHGAYLRFLPRSLHPLDQGADLCVDSAHKTLPVLTGGAYLHIAKGMTGLDRADVKAAMSLFASTSPSYLILASLDRCNRYLEERCVTEQAELIARLDAMKRRLTDAGVHLRGREPMKLTLRAPEGSDGQRLHRALRERGVECEMGEPDHVVLMLTPALSDRLEAVERAILAAWQPWIGRPPRVPPALPQPGPRAMSIREAMLSPQETLPLEQCEGRVLAADTTGCPPAVPLAVCGETLTAETVALCRYYGLRSLRVVRLQ